MSRGLPSWARRGLKVTSGDWCVCHARPNRGRRDRRCDAGTDAVCRARNCLPGGTQSRHYRREIAHADPAADWLTTTIALDASLRLSGGAGSARSKFRTSFEVLWIRPLVKAKSSPTCWFQALGRRTLGPCEFAKKLGDFAQSMAVAVVDPERRSPALCWDSAQGRQD